MEFLNTLLYCAIAFYTVKLWVSLISRLRQKQYQAALSRFIGFVPLYGISMLPLLVLSRVPLANVLIGSIVFLAIIATLFSKDTPSKPLQFGSFSTSAISSPTQSNEVSFFQQKPVADPQEIKVLEEESAHLWRNYATSQDQNFWEDYEKVLVKMKSLSDA
ncbi:MAG TPA: hypothetical protein DCS93_12515 [Microscillaceae bacterium]|nr:hypothetical protein [Microscillaceae bacterium]